LAIQYDIRYRIAILRASVQQWLAVVVLLTQVAVSRGLTGHTDRGSLAILVLLTQFAVLS
jgi:hypothetical protein